MAWPGRRDTIGAVHGLQSRAIATVVASMLTAIPVAPVAAGAPPEVPGAPAAEDHAPAVVLGLDAEEAEVGARLTLALRRAFAARGLAGGEEANLAEVRLALGCQIDRPECLAGGGELLRSRRLIYGSLHKFESGRWALDISILEVEAVEISAHETFKLQGADLVPARIDQLAEELVDRLLPDELRVTIPDVSAEQAPPPPPPPDGVAGNSTSSRASSKSKRDREFEWGYQRPTPRWKWVNFGVSLGLTLATAGATIGTGAWLTASEARGWGFRHRLIEAANNSLRSPDPINRVSPTALDICEYNVTNDDGRPLLTADGEPGARNTGVDNVCRSGSQVQQAQIVLGIVTGVGLLRTAIFTVQLFVHRKPGSRVADAWRRRGLRLGLSPTWGRGSALRLGGRF